MINVKPLKKHQRIKVIIIVLLLILSVQVKYNKQQKWKIKPHFLDNISNFINKN